MAAKLVRETRDQALGTYKPKNKMKNHANSTVILYAVTLMAFVGAPRMDGQAVPQPAPVADSSNATQPNVQTVASAQEPALEMDPFIVDTSKDAGSYHASTTLAGARVKTNLADVPSSLSVITAQFMQDTGATDNQSLLVYVPNTEVGGAYGNFAGVGNTFLNGISESATLLNPQNNTRVRGLDSADNTRDYFQTDIPWDSFDTDRIDLQRGPNSILFGIGSPAGIINASSTAASFADSYKLENRFGSYNSLRNSLDFNKVLLRDELAFRFALLDDNTEYRQKPAFNHDERLYAALRWDPKFLNKGSAHTTLRANFEAGRVNANNPRVLPPDDMITSFFNPAGINKTAWDPYYVMDAGVQATAGNATLSGLTRNPWIAQGMGSGIQGGYNPAFSYNNLSGPSTPISSYQAEPYTWGGITATSFVPGSGGSIGGFPYGHTVGIAGYGNYAVYNNEINPNDPSTLGGILGVYKDKSLTNMSIFNSYDNLIDGPNKFEDQNWHTFNITLDQTFLNGRLAFNMVDDYQKYYSKEESNLSNPFISVDINANSVTKPWPYATSVTSYNGTGTAGTNPYAGYAYTGGSGQANNDSFASTRNNLRATVTGDIRASDFMGRSILSDILGDHVFTGLLSSQTYETETRAWDRYAVAQSYAAATSPPSSNYAGLTSGIDVIDMITYLSPTSLFNLSSADGLNLKPITTTQSPSGTATVSWFNSAWKWPTNPSDPSYVNPAAAWTNPTTLTGSAAATQSSNPANYVGWTTGTFPILNADQGDINSLYTAGTKIKTETTSGGIVWQGSFWKDMLAVTYGVRRDEQRQSSGTASISPVTGAAVMDYGLGAYDEPTIANSTSWGFVLHEPESWRNALPWGTNISLIYDIGNNERVQTRYGFGGSALPNASGHTKDYGFQLNTLNDRVSLKAIWYDTKVQNANLSSVTTTTSTLGANSYAVYQLEAAGTVGAMIDEKGFAGQSPSLNWFWNWAYVDAGFPNDTGNGNWIGSPSSQAFQNSPDTATEKAAVASWLSQMQPQSWWNAYNYNVNVAAAKAGDWANAIPGYNYESEGSGGLNAGGGGLINGVPPTGTANNESKGVEFELVGQITDSWNISINASKQFATETSLGADVVNFITAQHDKMLSPAGLLRLYWGGDYPIRQYYNEEVWAPFEFIEGSSGRMVPEMSPWRANAVTNYTFKKGAFRGINVGGAYRWQQGEILGYGMLPDGSNLNVNQPYWGPSISNVDLWIGYGHKLTRDVNWHIQLNVRSVGQNPHLEPISAEPDGSWAQYRINEGQSWELSNTLTF